MSKYLLAAVIAYLYLLYQTKKS